MQVLYCVSELYVYVCIGYINLIVVRASWKQFQIGIDIDREWVVENYNKGINVPNTHPRKFRKNIPIVCISVCAWRRIGTNSLFVLNETKGSRFSIYLMQSRWDDTNIFPLNHHRIKVENFSYGNIIIVLWINERNRNKRDREMRWTQSTKSRSRW